MFIAFSLENFLNLAIFQVTHFFTRAKNDCSEDLIFDTLDIVSEKPHPIISNHTIFNLIS